MSAYAHDRAEQPSQGYDALQRAVQVLHAMLAKQLDLAINDGSLRAYEPFSTEMVSEWGYTRAEATKLTRDRQTSTAVLILGQHGVIGVVYLDSNRRDLFSP